MPIDLAHEKLVRMRDAKELFPEGVRPHRSTFERWWRSGCRGVLLETVLVGGHRFTSAEAVGRFLVAINGNEPGAGSQAIASKQRLERIRAADEILDKAGI